MNSDAALIDEIVLRRSGSEPPHREPAWFDLTPESFGADLSDVRGRVRLGVPAGWKVQARSLLHWRVIAGEVDPDQFILLRLVVLERGKSARHWQRCLPVRLLLRSTFDINRHAFPLPNSARVLGDVRGSRSIFQETYATLPSLPANLLFEGLYQDIVYIGGSGEHRGGFCSGMARWAGLRSVHDDDSDVPMVDALREITRLHGRQLLDRALISSAGWFLRGSPRAAYRAMRDEMLATGRSNRAFDLAVPVPWRRDVLTALIREGHTVVPYKIEQPHPGWATVTVYDPNRGREPHEMIFDLRRNRYGYRSMVSLDDDGYGLIAIRHVAYATKGTAILATIGSLFWRFLRRGNGK